MRVLHVTTEFPPVVFGGLGTAVGGWVLASAHAGIDVAVLLVDGPLVLDGDATYGAPRRRTAQPVSGRGRTAIEFFLASSADAVSAGIRAVRTWRPDVVHLHTAMLWSVAEAIQRVTGTPLVYHVHSVDRAEYEFGDEPNPWLAASREQEEAVAAADRVIALTRPERDLLCGYYPSAEPRIRVVGNGVDDTLTARGSAFDGHRIPAPLVLYSGRLVERKGIRELLAAIPIVLAAVPEARIVFAGGPPLLSGAQVASQWLGLEHESFAERIHFTGWLSSDELAHWYVRADILVVPSRYEPFGMVVLEGMLYGLPIVAANVGGPAEILRDHETALLVPPRDAAALSSALIWLLMNPRERHEIGHRAADRVRTSWLWPQKVPAMLDVYRELVPPVNTVNTVGVAR
jgi:glycogen synthase